MFSEDQELEIVELLSGLSNSTRLYIGCDSQCNRASDGNWYSNYATVLAVHKDGRRGCKIFYTTDRERNFDARKDRPSQRLLGEVQRVVELYNQLEQIIKDFDVEIHLDISTDPKYGSNCVAQQAAGYVLGTTGIEPKLKPESWAASFGADGIGRGFHERKPDRKTHKIKKRKK